MPVDVLALPSSSMNTKWKEPYASASLNQKLVGVIAPGIYRGLLLQPDIALGDRTIVVQVDPVKLDHVAVYENANGFSVTYRDGTSGNITLLLTAYSNITVVICLFIDYQSGVTTTGSFRVFTVAEFNALSASDQNALVVLGTVVVPVSGAIPSGNISPLRRTLASANFQEGMVPNSPLVRNPGFEIGATNATYPKSSIFWDKSVTAGTGTWKTSTVVVATGVKAIELSVAAGALTGDLSQQVGIETAAGEQFFASVSLKQLKTISSGTLQFFMEWSDVNDALLTTTTQSLDGGGIDIAFRTVPVAALAPAGAVSLRTIGIRATALSPLTFGIFAYIDNVDVNVVPRNPKYPYPLDQAFRRNEITSGLVVEDKAGNFSSLAALLGFDLSTPASEGRAVLERRDQDYSGANLPPVFALFGRLFQLGSKLLGTDANALKPRISADISTVGGVEFTLMWESGRNGETTGTYTQPVVRMYGSPSGMLFFTANAAYNGTNWNKDVAGVEAFRLQIAGSQIGILYQIAGTATWAEASWLTSLTQLSSGLTLPLGTASSQYTFAAGQLTMRLNSGVDRFVFTPSAMTFRADLLPGTDNSNSVGASADALQYLWSRKGRFGPSITDDTTKLVQYKSEWSWPSQTDQVDFDYISAQFGVPSRAGHRLFQEWDANTALPAGWEVNTSGGGTGNAVLQNQHRVKVSHDGGSVGTYALKTVNTVKFRLTDGFVCRVRLHMFSDFALPYLGFFDVGGSGNGITIGPRTVDGGGAHNVQFAVGAGLTLVGGPGDHAFSSVQRWWTFALVGTTLWWTLDTVTPDGGVSPSDSFSTAGSATITVPTGLYHFVMRAVGSGGGFGSYMEVDSVEIVTGGRDS